MKQKKHNQVSTHFTDNFILIPTRLYAAELRIYTYHAAKVKPLRSCSRMFKEIIVWKNEERFQNK